MEVEINPEIICAGKKFAIHELFIQASAAETLKGKKKKKKKDDKYMYGNKRNNNRNIF